MAYAGVDTGRRAFIRDAAALAATVGAARVARAAGDPWQVVRPGQVAAIEALGDTILPGASAAGLADFLDAQLAKPPEQALLTLRYLDVVPSYAGFYAAAAAALDAESRRVHGIDFASLGAGDRERIVTAMSGGDLSGWTGPSAPLVYFVVRSDAPDLVMGPRTAFSISASATCLISRRRSRGGGRALRRGRRWSRRRWEPDRGEARRRRQAYRGARRRAGLDDCGPGQLADLVAPAEMEPRNVRERRRAADQCRVQRRFRPRSSALHHHACWFRLHPEDFHMRSLHGRGQDWPITYGDLRPFYDRVQREVGISGDAAAEVWRPEGEPYPMPPLDTSPQGSIVAKGFEAVGLRTAPLPRAINSVAYDDRPAWICPIRITASCSAPGATGSACLGPC